MKKIGRDLVVSVLAFNYDDPSSNPAGFYNFLFKKTKNAKRHLLIEIVHFMKLVQKGFIVF